MLVFWYCIAFIKTIHGNNISLSTLTTALPRNGKTSRTVATVKCSQKELFDAVESELDGSSGNFRCILISNGIMYRQENVRKTAQQKDTEHVEPKKYRWLYPKRYVSPGPKFVLYIDDHHKSKPYGFSIHGCIDGFLQRMLQSGVSTSKKC